MKTDDNVIEHRTGLRCPAPFAAAAVALLSVSCATQVSMETTAYEGGPASAVLEEHGEPDFRYRDDNDGVTYISYRLPGSTREFRCSAIYTVRDDNIIASKLTGKACPEGSRFGGGGVNKLASGLEGKDVGDVLMMFGGPDYGGLSGGSGTLVYDYGEASDSVTGNVGGGVSVGIGFSLGCTMTITVEDGRVAGAETGGGMCWLTRL